MLAQPVSPWVRKFGRDGCGVSKPAFRLQIVISRDANLVMTPHTPLTADELRAAQATAVYVRAYATRCGHAVGGAIDRAAVEAYAEALL